jgi:hypothetical protein
MTHPTGDLAFRKPEQTYFSQFHVVCILFDSLLLAAGSEVIPGTERFSEPSKPETVSRSKKYLVLGASITIHSFLGASGRLEIPSFLLVVELLIV